jgi:hypothetical protein
VSTFLSAGKPLAALFGVAACLPALGAGPWDGLWYRDTARTHQSDHTYKLEPLPKDQWRYDDGSTVYVFAADGKPWPEPMSPGFVVTATSPDPNVLDLVESGYGREMQRYHRMLSQDGNAMSISSVRTFPDGREVISTSVAIRIAGGPGFAGTWRELAARPDKHPVDQSPATATPPGRRPFWVISTAPDGVITWFIPATGELIRGKPDGEPHPLTGPQQPAARTFIWKQPSPRRLEFYALDSGHVVERAIETLSPDGKTFTDELWAVGHEDEKDVNVYTKD